MNTATLLSQHLIGFLEGGNLTGSHLKQQLEDVTYDQAVTKIGSLNTIALLTYHINYYLAALIKVLDGGPLEARDALSFKMTSLKSEDDWELLRSSLYYNIEQFAAQVGFLSDEGLTTTFVKDQYGSYQHNIMGLIEHSHYHLGQIAILRKLVTSKTGL